MKRAIHLSPFPEQALGFNCARLRADEGETTDRIATAKHTLLVVMASLGLAGCAVTPQILTFNYAVRTVPDATALITSVQSGQTTVAELISLLSPGPSLCNFTADFSGATPPRTSLSGTPGQTGFNVRIFSTALLSITTTNPSSCAALGEVEINIGGRSQALALGAQTSLTNGRIRLSGPQPQEFTDSQFFQARVEGFDSANRRSNGDFRFINRLAPGSNTVLVVEGSYNLTP